jgi:parvulin-like peptidyl-prolyl isomerase
VLEDIDKGKIPFNEAARQYSIDKAGRSGLLGWKRRNELDQDFWAAALEVEEGEYTKEPIKTQVSARKG